MNARAWGNLALALVVLALAGAIYFKPDPKPVALRVSTLAPAEIGHIEIAREGQAPIVLERGARGWALRGPFTARADVLRTQRLLEILDARSTTRLDAGDPGRFDLDKPQVKLSLGAQTFSFGTVNPLTGEQYVATQGAVYLLALRYAAALPRQPEDMISRRPLADDEQPIGFELRDFSVTQSDGKWLLQPSSAALSQDDFNRWVDDWRFASATQVQPSPGAAAGERIRVALKDGRGIVFTVVKREPDLLVERDDERLRYRIPAASAKTLLAPPAAR
ncbi:MAG TPA: DUF4340 domain-containing protein [Burkholderiales bacterium]|nr:DUF4340 domain-containing protein [Burkholderiales bacterium]